MGEASAPMLFFQFAAIRPESIGAEAPPTKDSETTEAAKPRSRLPPQAPR
ncbi:DUF6053 domain-containing protein [Lysobacter gummosus]